MSNANNTENSFPSKDIVLTKRLNRVIYELMVKTTANMVYVEENVTLTEKLFDIIETILELNERHDTLENAFADVMRDAPETFRTFKEVWNYVNVNGDPESELIRLIKSKQDSEPGKGLSTHDFTDILYEKVVNDYTKEELDAKFTVVIGDVTTVRELVNVLRNDVENYVEYAIEKFNDLDQDINTLKTRPNIVLDENVPEIYDYNCWYKIISRD